MSMRRSHPRTMGGRIALSMHCAASSTSTVAMRMFSLAVKERRISDWGIEKEKGRKRVGGR